jgi:hypothetical protein
MAHFFREFEGFPAAGGGAFGGRISVQADSGISRVASGSGA